jgi:hypothetical protein
MTDSKALPRPPQVTMAGWVAIVGSVFVVIGVWEVIANLRSLDTRERVEKMLSESPMDGTGIGVDDWLSIMHTVSLVAAGCATAAAILGWHVLKRSRGARVGLTVVAVPLFVTGLFAGAFLSSMVAVAAALLWTKPSRDWFDGIAAAPPPSRRSESAGWPPAAGGPPGAGGPPAPSGPSYRLPPPPGSPQSPGSADQPPPPPYPFQRTPVPPPAAMGSQGPAFSTARPTELLQACLVTWVCAGFVLMGSALVLLAMGLDPSLAKDIYEQDETFADAGLTPDSMRSFFLTICSVIAVWSTGAIALAVFAFLGRNWARIGLVAFAVSAGLFCLVLGVSSPVLLIPATACGAAAFLLLRPQVRSWFTDRF